MNYVHIIIQNIFIIFKSNQLSFTFPLKYLRNYQKLIKGDKSSIVFHTHIEAKNSIPIEQILKQHTIIPQIVLFFIESLILENFK